MFFVLEGPLFCMLPLHFCILLLATFFDDRLAPGAEPLNVLNSITSRQEYLWYGHVRKIILLAIGLEAWLDVEGARTVVAADQLAAVFAMVAVVPVFYLLLSCLRRVPRLGSSSTSFRVQPLILRSISLAAFQNLTTIGWLWNCCSPHNLRLILVAALDPIHDTALPICIINSSFFGVTSIEDWLLWLWRVCWSCEVSGGLNFVMLFSALLTKHKKIIWYLNLTKNFWLS